MAKARLIYQRETTDTTLNELTFAHIVSFNRLVTHADDWGRFYGDPDLWKAQLFPRQPYMTLDLILAVQHDLADAELVGFYDDGGESWCVIYKFAQYQQLKTDRLGMPLAPRPPDEMLPMVVHPRNAGKKYDPPDLSYRQYQRIVAQQNPNQRIWTPAEPRPPIHFVVNADNPIGAIEHRQPETNQRQASLLEVAPEWADDIDRAAGILEAVPKWPGKRVSDSKTKTRNLLQKMKGMYPELNIIEVCDGYATWCLQNPLGVRSNGLMQVQNRFKIQEQMRTNTYRVRDNEIPEEGRVVL